MGLFNLFKPTKTILVIDGVSLNESMGMKGKVPPRNQLQVLRRLSRFSQREKIEMVVVLSGAPLNKAPAGKKFEDVVVLYSASLDAHAKFLAKTVSAKGGGAILITGNEAAEKLLGSASKKMRTSSFRKAFDSCGDGEGSDRGNGGNGNNRSRPPRKRQPRSQSDQSESRNKDRNNDRNNDRNERKDRGNRNETKKNSDADAINELIDLVD